MGQATVMSMLPGSAATALVHGLTVVAHEGKDFEASGVPLFSLWDAEG